MYQPIQVQSLVDHTKPRAQNPNSNKFEKIQTSQDGAESFIDNSLGSISNSHPSSIFNLSKTDFEPNPRGAEGSGKEAESKGSDTPCTLVFYVLPVFCFMNWAFIIPHKIKYDPGLRAFRKVPGSAFARIGCVIHNISSLLYLMAYLLRFQKGSNGSMLAVMNQFMFGIFIFLYVSIFYIMWTKMDNIADILTKATEMTTQFQSYGVHIPQSNMARAGIWFLVAIHFVIATLTGLQVQRYNGTSATGWDFLNYAVKVLALTVGELFPPLLGYRVDPLDFETMPRSTVAAIGVASQVLEILSNCVWIFANLVIHLWGLMFRKLFTIFFVKMRSSQFLMGNILEDIREFNSLTMLLDKFNSTFGTLTFFMVLSTILYTSVSIGKIITMDFNSNRLSISIILLTFIPFFGMILAASLVNDLANDFTLLVKDQFNQQNGGSWIRTYGNSLEISQGLSIVYYDLQTQAVGFKGLGFFTVSYSFVGSVLSVIATYAVVAIQFASADTAKA